MARPAAEECNSEILKYHNSIYTSVNEQDKILEAYFKDKTRDVPTPLEISIYLRQLRNNPKRIRITEERMIRKLRDTVEEKVYKLLIDDEN